MASASTRKGHALRPEEEWARQLMTRVLGCSVSGHDDGSEAGMYDLRVGPRSAPTIAIECVGAVDPAFTETWNIGPARGPVKTALTGDWLVDQRVGSDSRLLRQQIGSALAELNEAGEVSFPVDFRLRRVRPDLHARLDRLGVGFVSCYRYPGEGKVSFTMPGWGGGVDGSGSSVPSWISDFLRDPKRKNKLDKLARSGADEKHMFVAVTIAGAPWSVESYLTSEMSVAPAEPCDLPPAVDAVWICPTHGSKGLFWNGERWRLISLRPTVDPVGSEPGGTMKGTMGTTNVCPGQAAEISRPANDVHLLASSD